MLGYSFLLLNGYIMLLLASTVPFIFNIALSKYLHGAHWWHIHKYQNLVRRYL